MGNDPYVPLEWFFWCAAIGAAGIALVRAEFLSSNTGPGLRSRSAGQLVLWLICIASTILGFVLAAISTHTG